MSEIESLKDVYADEIKDLWSANEQMARVLKTLSAQAHDPKLKSYLTESVEGIGRHNETIKSLLADAGEEVEMEHCKGMEGLVKEALKHGVKEAPDVEELHDLQIISQYQRMSHYGLAGFGTAAAYATALGMKEHATKLKGIVSDIYKADEATSHMGEKVAKLSAKHAKSAV